MVHMHSNFCGLFSMALPVDIQTPIHLHYIYNVLERESESAYQGSEATLLRDFNRFYIKGLNGGKLSEVSEKYAKVMTERSMTEAFKAGQSDRGAMLKEKFQAVNNAVIRDGGLIHRLTTALRLTV